MAQARLLIGDAQRLIAEALTVARQRTGRSGKAGVELAPSGCWIWTGAVNNRGYPCWGRSLAHRRMYELLIGRIPNGLELDHLCKVPRCVNPEHLEPVDHAENVRRSSVGQVNAERMLSRTHCKNGHPFTLDNVSTHSGWRRCKACHREATARWQARRAES